MLDIIYLWHEDCPNWDSLIGRFPWAKKVRGDGGIKAGHIRAAQMARTKHFYVVDEDNIITEDFDFSFKPPIGEEDMLHLWYARNSVNDLEYGYGGIKLFPRQAVLDSADLTTTDYSLNVTEMIKIHGKVASVTAFNTDAFSAWRAGFREAAKLSHSGTDMAKDHLLAWKTKGVDRPFGSYTMRGAQEGYDMFAYASEEELTRINDFEWLRRVFAETDFS